MLPRKTRQPRIGLALWVYAPGQTMSCRYSARVAKSDFFRVNACRVWLIMKGQRHSPSIYTLKSTTEHCGEFSPGERDFSG